MITIAAFHCFILCKENLNTTEESVLNGGVATLIFINIEEAQQGFVLYRCMVIQNIQGHLAVQGAQPLLWQQWRRWLRCHLHSCNRWRDDIPNILIRFPHHEGMASNFYRGLPSWDVYLGTPSGGECESEAATNSPLGVETSWRVAMYGLSSVMLIWLHRWILVVSAPLLLGAFKSGSQPIKSWKSSTLSVTLILGMCWAGYFLPPPTGSS